MIVLKLTSNHFRPLMMLGLLNVASGCIVADYGGGGGGGPSETSLPPRPLHIAVVDADPVRRGADLYKQQGCVLCHGQAGSGGVSNPNSDTGGKINGLTLVKEGYTPEQLAHKIAEGVPEVGRQDSNASEPPFRMPAFGSWLPDEDVTALATYLISLYPEDREADEDNWDE